MGGFYSGSWFVQNAPSVEPDDWKFPADKVTQYIRATSNVEELFVRPEDMDLRPELVQHINQEWTIQSPPESGFYTIE